MLEREIERLGIPAVLVTTLLPTAQTMGANRVVPGRAITSPLGDPEAKPQEERDLRRRIVISALEALTRPAG